MVTDTKRLEVLWRRLMKYHHVALSRVEKVLAAVDVNRLEQSDIRGKKPTSNINHNK
jgi:hypothetical protein